MATPFLPHEFSTARRLSVAWARLGCCLVIAASTAAIAAAEEEDTASPEVMPAKVSFNVHIRPIFAKHCVACHGGVKQASGLSLIYREQALADAESGLVPI